MKGKSKMEGGLKWHDVGFLPETAEFIEGRKFQIEEIARIFQVPLILLQSTEGVKVKKGRFEWDF